MNINMYMFLLTSIIFVFSLIFYYKEETRDFKFLSVFFFFCPFPITLNDPKILRTFVLLVVMELPYMYHYCLILLFYLTGIRN